MNQEKLTSPIAAVISAAVLICIAQPVRALDFDARPVSIRQNNFTAGVYLGHWARASSGVNKLTVSGSFDASCISGHTGNITGHRTVTEEVFAGGTQLDVMFPESIPSLEFMPGFENVPGGTDLSCTYRWSASAKEGTITVGVPGIGITFGGGEAGKGGTVSFLMYQPGAGGADDNNGCIR